MGVETSERRQWSSPRADRLRRTVRADRAATLVIPREDVVGQEQGEMRRVDAILSVNRVEQACAPVWTLNALHDAAVKGRSPSWSVGGVAVRKRWIERADG